jgi:hypothetical protein
MEAKDRKTSELDMLGRAEKHTIWNLKSATFAFRIVVVNVAGQLLRSAAAGVAAVMSFSSVISMSSVLPKDSERVDILFEWIIHLIPSQCHGPVGVLSFLLKSESLSRKNV